MLKFIANISNWNTKNVKNINYIFDGCLSITLLPVISKWRIYINEIFVLFDNCISLTSLINISYCYLRSSE